MHSLHGDLESVETAGLGYLDVPAKAMYQVFHDHPVRGGEESQDCCDEVALVRRQSIPISLVPAKIHLRHARQ